MDLKMVETEARLFATPLAQKIGEKANTYPNKVEGVAFAGTCASLVFQTMTLSILIDQFEPGSAEGEAHIRTVYAEAIKDAVARWHKSDLKDQRLRRDLRRQQG